MALGAMASHKVQVKVVPIGLKYFAPDKFRSKAFLDIGEAIEVPQELAEKFQQGGSAKI
jgi:glycerol-3-phosphate O-acyltransferase/dihydroxyacetone phosphate acyltransferase